MEKSRQKYKIKIIFSSPVRIGSPGMDDQNVRQSIGADQFFSWISIGWIKLFGLEEFENKVLKPFNTGSYQWIHSDLFPSDNEGVYFPTPAKLPKVEKEEDEIDKKERTKWITKDGLEKIINGSSLKKGDFKDPIKEVALQTARTSVFLTEESKPFITTALVSKKENNELSFTGLIDFSDEKIKVDFEKVLGFMKDEGFGANRSSGLGQIQEATLEENKDMVFTYEGDQYLILSFFYPKDENELKEISSDKDCAYTLSTKAGWIYDESGNPTDKRKQKIFLFDSGSVFSKKPTGRLINVGYKGHESFRYCIPYTIGIKNVS